MTLKMKNNTTKLSLEQNYQIQVQTRMEAWMNNTGMVVAKVVFWIIIFLSITVDINGQSMTFAENDVNQTPMCTSVSGNILTNDCDPTNDEQWVKSVTFLDGLGNQHAGQISGRPFQIYAENGILAGSMSLYMNGDYEFAPDSDFKGSMLVNYVVEDDSGMTDAATLCIHVIPPDNLIRNDKPIAHNDTNTTEMGMEVEGNVITSNDFDLENDVLNIHAAFADIDGDGTNDEPLTVGVGAVVYGKDMYNNLEMAGVITLNSDGSYHLDPIAEFSGKLSVKYKVTDGRNGIAQANLTILVLPDSGNQGFANDDMVIGNKNMTQSGNVLTNDHSLEGASQIITSAKNNRGFPLTIDGTTENELRSSGSIIMDTDGSFTYSPRSEFIGTESIIYVICDNNVSEETCDTATLYLTSIPSNNIGSGGIGGIGGGSIGVIGGRGIGGIGRIESIDNSNRISPEINLIGNDLLAENISGEFKEFSLYPNPGIVGDGLINLAFKSTTGEAHIQIADMNGRIVKRLLVDANTNKMNNLEMDVADLMEGKYFLQLIDGGKSYS